MKEPTKLKVLYEILNEARKEQIGIEISMTIKQRTIIRLITPATETLRNKMEQQIAIDQINMESQGKVIQVIRELIAEEEKKDGNKR